MLVSHIAGTLQRFFVGQQNLALLAVDTEKLGESLKWEVGIDVDDTFPHFYGTIPPEAILWEREIGYSENKHTLPQLD